MATATPYRKVRPVRGRVNSNSKLRLRPHQNGAAQKYAERAELATGPAAKASPFDRRLAGILDHATEVFCTKGYEGASMRDLSRATHMSLAGLYHYFESKEELLYLIQKHTFATIVQRLRQRLEGVSQSEERVRIFIQNHLEYFLANQKAMKVLSHEDDALKNGYGAEIATIKREYYRICSGLMDELKAAKNLRFKSRIAVLSLFGMMNWIYTWHNPRVDADAESLASQMTDIFLNGVLNCSPAKQDFGGSLQLRTEFGATKKMAHNGKNPVHQALRHRSQSLSSLKNRK